LKVTIKEIIARNLSEIENALTLIKEEEIDEFIKKVFSARRIFVAGAGRSGILIKAFAMRLMQMGFRTYVVGETTTPAIKLEDLLILMSGSGQTRYSYYILESALKVGAYTYLITAHKNSKMWRIAQGRIKIPGPTKLCSLKKNKSSQLLGSLFEQGAFILLECIIERIAREIKLRPDDIMLRHANLE